MPKVYFGRKDEPGFDLDLSDDLIAVRTRSGRSITRSAGPVASPASEQLDDAKLVTAYPEAGVEVFRVPVGRDEQSLDARKTALRTVPDVRFAGGVLTDPSSGEPVLYTENLFVKFIDTADGDACRQQRAGDDLHTRGEINILGGDRPEHRKREAIFVRVFTPVFDGGSAHGGRVANNRPSSRLTFASDGDFEIRRLPQNALTARDSRHAAEIATRERDQNRDVRNVRSALNPGGCRRRATAARPSSLE